jgi:hypothetical protein
MSVPSYAELPYNGLATSSEIILNQIEKLGITVDRIEPSGGDSTLNLQGLTQTESALFDPRQPDERSDAIRELASKPSVPINKYNPDDPIIKLYGSPDPTTAAKGTKVFNGPPDTGATLGGVLTTYGLPSSLGELFSDAEEAFSGILYDLNHIRENKLSVYDILAKNNRMRGLGALFIAISIIGILLNNLFISH